MEEIALSTETTHVPTVAMSGKEGLGAAGSLGHELWANNDHTAINGTFTISSEFNRHLDPPTPEMWSNGDHPTFLKILGEHPELCSGEGSMHDTLALHGSQGWDEYDAKCEVVTENFPSSGTGQTNVIFPVQ